MFAPRRVLVYPKRSRFTRVRAESYRGHSSVRLALYGLALPCCRVANFFSVGSDLDAADLRAKLLSQNQRSGKTKVITPFLLTHLTVDSKKTACGLSKVVTGSRRIDPPRLQCRHKSRTLRQLPCFLHPDIYAPPLP